MIYLKSIMAGIGAALLTVLLLALTVFVVLRFEAWRLEGPSGEGGIGAVSIGAPLPLVPVLVGLAFVAGFWWEFRRASR